MSHTHFPFPIPTLAPNRGGIRTIGATSFPVLMEDPADWVRLPDGKTASEWPPNVRPYLRLDVDTPAGCSGTSDAAAIGGERERSNSGRRDRSSTHLKVRRTCTASVSPTM